MIQKNKKVIVHNLGLTPYKECWDFQEKLLKEIVATKRANRNSNDSTPTQNHLIWVEHPPVYTLGNSGDIKNMLIDKAQLESEGIKFFNTNRGGDITFHGIGQIVCYPILDLDNFFTDIHKYLRLLEQVIIDTVEEFGVKGTRSPGETGVWVDAETPFARKICAMGVRASQWVTMHGFALNVNTDLSYFEHIVPCGIIGKGVTSLQKEYGQGVDVGRVILKLQKYFSEHFEADMLCT